MNRTFINLIVEGYLLDNQIDLNKKDSSAQKIVEIMEEIKENDYELYNYIHDLSKSKQKNLIYNLLTEEIDISSSVSSLGFIFFVIFSAYWMFSAQSDRVNKFKTFFQRLQISYLSAIKIFKDKWSRSDRAMDLIITDNYHNCLNKCEITNGFTKQRGTMIQSLYKLYSKNGFNGITKGWFKSDSEKLTQSQLNCLVTCSLDSLSTIIAKYAGLYINCVKKSNILYADVKIYNTLDLGRLPSNIESCKEVRENYKSLYDNYIYILDFLFKGVDRDSIIGDQHAKWMDILERKIQSTSENNYTKLLDVSKQFVGDDTISKPGVRF